MASGSSGIKAGKAFVVLEVYDKTAFVLRRAARRIQGFANDIQAMGQKMLTRGLLAMTPAALSLSVFTKFDDAMKKVEARSAGTATEMSNLREQAKELGRTTSFTASQVGELQAKLAQKGLLNL